MTPERVMDLGQEKFKHGFGALRLLPADRTANDRRDLGRE